jgi:hypothetical protein
VLKGALEVSFVKNLQLGHGRITIRSPFAEHRAAGRDFLAETQMSTPSRIKNFSEVVA